MINDFSELMQKAEQLAPLRVSVAMAEDRAVLQAIVEAKKRGIAEGLLFGKTTKIVQILQEISPEAPGWFDIREANTEIRAARYSVDAIHAKEAQILLKGKINTATLLKAVLDTDKGLRTGRLLSDVFIVESPFRRENRLIFITDGGVTLKPDIKQKIQLIENVVKVAHALGNKMPRVALLSAVETVNPKLPATIDAAVISKMNDRGQITGCIIDGPLALDNAISLESAQIKEIDSPVAGNADILICPEIESANMLAKSTTYFANLPLAHIMMGAKVPVLIPSRSDTFHAKLMSIALGKVICNLLNV